jgi:hypothetical protein
MQISKLTDGQIKRRLMAAPAARSAMVRVARDLGAGIPVSEVDRETLWGGMSAFRWLLVWGLIEQSVGIDGGYYHLSARGGRLL